MLSFPKSTQFNKRIPKQKFYENLSVTPALKRVFVEQIRMIWWRNKIAPETVNLARGDEVTELEVFEIQLSRPSLDEAVLRLIDREIPYHILFLLTHQTDKYPYCLRFCESLVKDDRLTGKASTFSDRQPIQRNQCQNQR